MLTVAEALRLVLERAQPLPPETIVTTDVGSHKYLFGQFWPSREPETFWMSNGLSGMAFDSVDGQPIAPHIVDGNYVVASKHPRPWIKQLNLLAAYAYFFNPLRMLLALVWSLSRLPRKNFPSILFG